MRLNGRHICCLAALAACMAPASVLAGKWQIERVNHTVLTPPAGVTVDQMSGVTYLGLVGGNHRFVAVQETRSELVGFDVAFDSSGAITGASNVAAIGIAPLEVGEDFEGIAFTNPARNSVFLSDEDALSSGDNLGVREVSLATGAELQAVSIPSVFANRRANRGFESLTRSPAGTVMWTANEQALSVDGPTSTPSAGADVRLLKLNVAGDTVAAGPQYAYLVESIHGSSPAGDPQSGLSELVTLPDGTLITLERSVAVVFPGSIFLNRIYEVDFAGATDVSAGNTAASLSGQTFARVGKELLWSGAADNAFGQNLEGLTLGPRLANGDWILLGVVDKDAADALSMNTVVAFTARANPSADFDDDGDVDGADFLNWQRGAGKAIGAIHLEGDADRDGDADGDDLTVWKSNFPSEGAAHETASAVPEPGGFYLAISGLAIVRRATRRRRR